MLIIVIIDPKIGNTVTNHAHILQLPTTKHLALYHKIKYEINTANELENAFDNSPDFFHDLIKLAIITNPPNTNNISAWGVALLTTILRLRIKSIIYII